MVQQHAPQVAWLGVGILVLLAVGLAILGLVVAVTVLIASGRASAISRPLKTAGLAMLLIVPALAVVGLVGGLWTVRTVGQSQTGSPFDNGPVTLQTEAHRIEMPREAPAQSLPAVENRMATVADRVVTHSVESTLEGQLQVEASPTAESMPDISIASTSPAASAWPADLSRPATGVLHVRETRPSEPEWARNGALPSDSGVLVPLSSQRFATLAEAEQQITQLAVDYIKNFYRDEYPLPGDWTVPVSLIERHSVNTLVGEVLDKDFGNGIQGKMYRAHLRLEVNSKLRQALHDSWNDQLVKLRLTNLGTGLGMVTVMLAAVAGYFRLNEMTQGQYGGRLKLAAMALIGAAGLGVLAFR